MKEWPNDGRKWVIAFNMQSLISPIRHIIELRNIQYDAAEFVKWYYETYNKLDGDEFVYCTSTTDMREKEANIKQMYDETFDKEERRRKWNKWRAENQ